ncbi:SH3 domain-containing protein [Rhodobacteraceae bacterium D3-12]|nr:SH3 domain-containing protein [Rhodobacteraceae bacterium D3-12]
MTRRLLAAVLLLLPGFAMAQTQYPALHDVTGVASDDVLNVRAEPRGDAPVIGALSFAAKFVEVVRVENGWGLVTLGEGSGWASLRYLKAQPHTPGAFPDQISCYGTEPFWSLSYDGNNALHYSDINGADRLMRVQSILRAQGRLDRHALIAGSEDGLVTAVYARAQCSDGMSDRAYGFSVDAVLRDPDGHVLLSGCCTIKPE